MATLSSAPWRRAPWLLRRRPGVLATVAGASAVLAASLAAVPLFLSSVGTESVSVQAAERCPRDTGVSLQTGFSDPGSGAQPDLGSDPFTPLGDELGPGVLWLRRDGALARADGSGEMPVVLLTRDAALGHVDVVDGSPGPGLWISDRAASGTGLGLGDRATLVGATSPGVPVAGVYRDMAGPVDDDFWCAHADLLLPAGPAAELPPPVLLADRETFVDMVAALDDLGAGGGWDAPLRGRLTITDADRLVADLACGTDQAPALEWCANVRRDGARVIQNFAPQTAVTAAGMTVRFTPPPREYESAEDFVSDALHSHLPFVADRARGIQTSVAGGVWPVAGFAALAGIGLVAAAASLWFDRRRRELTLLSVRGVSPAGLGVKAALEALVALLVGCVAGVLLAYAAVIWLGPSSVIEAWALTRAIAAGAAALAAAALTVGVIVAGRAGTHQARHARRAWPRRVPWELALGAVTMVSYRRLGEWGVPVSRGAEVSKVDVLGLLFPVLFLVTGVAVVTRLLALGLPRLRSASRNWPTPVYLAVRRVARYRVAVVGLVAASAVAAGVLGYATTLNRSLDATLQAKAKTFIGSDVAVRLRRDQQIPAALAGRATDVAVFARAWVDDGGRRQDVVVLGIDPDTFERAAFWDASFAGQSLADLLGRLSAPAQGGSVPALLVQADVPTTTEAAIIAGGTTRFQVTQVAAAQAFPGMKGGLPTLYLAATALDELGVRTVVREAWIRGDRDDILASLDTAGVGFTEDRNFVDVVDRASFLTVSWTFGFMQSLGVVAGVLVVGGIAIYLDARRRGRVLGYAFARRMGLTARQHRRALLAELTLCVVLGCWLGLGIALLGAWSAYERIDPVPGFRPDPLLRPAGAVVVALAAAALIVAIVAAARPNGAPIATIRWRCSVPASDPASTEPAPRPAPTGPPDSVPAARCHGVSVDYDTDAGVVHALLEVDATFGRGRLSVVAGPSGSGKSSLLRALAGLLRPRAGTIHVDGTDAIRLRSGARRRLRRRAMGIVLQDPADNLVEYLTAREQIELAARLRGTDPGEAPALLAVVELTDRAASRPDELSGGEQQRIAFAAAAVGRPVLLLADEPTAELDGAAGAALVETMRGLVDGGASLVVASHDPAVIAAADHVVALRDGRVAST